MRFREIAPIFVHDEMQCLKASSKMFRDTYEFEMDIDLRISVHFERTCINNNKISKNKVEFFMNKKKYLTCYVTSSMSNIITLKVLLKTAQAAISCSFSRRM